MSIAIRRSSGNPHSSIATINPPIFAKSVSLLLAAPAGKPSGGGKRDAVDISARQLFAVYALIENVPGWLK